MILPRHVRTTTCYRVNSRIIKRIEARITYLDHIFWGIDRFLSVFYPHNTHICPHFWYLSGNDKHVTANCSNYVYYLRGCRFLK